MRAIEKLPGDRFQTASALAEELEGIVGTGCGLRGDRRTVRALEESGIVPPVVGDSGAAPSIRRKRDPSRRAIAGTAFLGLLVVGAAGVLQGTASRAGETAGAVPLELVPENPGFLRVLATPWAEVWVDGQQVETTPFARPVPLRPGTHYLALVHPKAPVERRTIEVVSGETKTFDVVMSVADKDKKK